MNGNSRGYWKLLLLALVLIVAGSLLGSWINTGAGAAIVTDVKIVTTDGVIISAYLYQPASATAQKPAPGALLSHGWNNQKNYMANTALELARRGYVVLNIDMAAHGYSTGGVFLNTNWQADALKYLRSLAYVDKKNIGLAGMSMGGSVITAAARGVPDGYNVMFFMEASCTSPCAGFKNVATNVGQWTELGAAGRDVTSQPSLQATFGITGTKVEVGKVYGSVADGTARILYMPLEDHAGSTDAPAAIGNLIDWFNLTIKSPNTLPGSDLIFGWKVLGTGLALFGAFLFLFPMGALLLRTSYFKPLVQALPEYKGFKGKWWWLGALITTALGPILYLVPWQNTALFPANSLWPQQGTNAYMVWAVLVGVIAIGLILFNHFVFTKKQGATAANYGLTSESKGLEGATAANAGLASEGKAFDWGYVHKSVALAVCILLPVYLLVLLINTLWKVDLRAWVLVLAPMNPLRFQSFFAYLIPFAIYFVPQGILFAGFLRVKEGKASVGREMVVNAVMLTLGAGIWLLLMYLPVLQGGPTLIAGAGIAAIYYIPFVVFWPLVACLYTYFFRKTGRVYAGILVVTLLMVWVNAAFGTFSVWP
jgi:uncharacterized protein